MSMFPAGAGSLGLPVVRHRGMLLLCMGLSASPGCSSEDTKSSSGGELPVASTDDSASPTTGPTDDDLDGDGHPASTDCNDADASVNPDAVEVCNEIDDNCDGAIDEGVKETFYRDDDGDSYGNPDAPVQACTAPDGAVSDPTDCDDEDDAVHPGAIDICNRIDDDCDGTVDEDGNETIYADADGDGWGDDGIRSTGCPYDGWALESGDCDDTDPTANPGVGVDFCDGVNNDCDDEIDEDSKAGWSMMSVNTADGNVYEIDTTNASLSSLTSVSTDIRINSMDVSENGQAYVHISSEKQIGLFDACTGTATPLGDHGAGGLGGISFGPGGRLFGLGGGEDTLWEFDLSTGVATAIGPLGIDVGSSGMAWDCSTQTMYGADTNQKIVFEVDLTTGEARNIQTTGVPFSSVGLEFDRETGLLYASSGTALYTVDPTNGDTTELGSFGVTNMDDLAWHPTCP